MRLRVSGIVRRDGGNFLIGRLEDSTEHHAWEGKLAGQEELLQMMRGHGVYREVPADEIVASGHGHQACKEALEDLLEQD